MSDSNPTVAPLSTPQLTDEIVLALPPSVQRAIKAIAAMAATGASIKEWVQLADAVVDMIITADSAGDLASQLQWFETVKWVTGDEPYERSVSRAMAHYMFVRWTVKSSNKFAMTFRLGSKHGAAAASRRTVRTAAKARQLIGKGSRDRVRVAADNYRFMSKEMAAPRIAEDVGLSQGTVRRYLSELFPGKAWKVASAVTNR